MKTFGNILWIIFGGALNALLWLFLGLLWCVTIIGIPLGKQCFKFARLTFAPFGKEVVDEGTTASTVANIFWIILTGIPMAIDNFIFAVVLCCTIIGIPFGKQYFKIARLSLAPFGVKIK